MANSCISTLSLYGSSDDAMPEPTEQWRRQSHDFGESHSAVDKLRYRRRQNDYSYLDGQVGMISLAVNKLPANVPSIITSLPSWKESGTWP